MQCSQTYAANDGELMMKNVSTVDQEGNMIRVNSLMFPRSFVSQNDRVNWRQQIVIKDSQNRSDYRS